MFGHMKAEPILAVPLGCSLEEAVSSLIEVTEGAQPFRWLEFPAAVLLFVTTTPDSQSGAFYVLDRKTSTWFWVDFDDEEYGGYSPSDFDLLVHEYDFLSLVERPGLLRAEAGWLLEPRKPAEMAGSLGK
jgi:hypothetical protein